MKIFIFIFLWCICLCLHITVHATELIVIEDKIQTEYSDAICLDTDASFSLDYDNNSIYDDTCIDMDCMSSYSSSSVENEGIGYVECDSLDKLPKKLVHLIYDLVDPITQRKLSEVCKKFYNDYIKYLQCQTDFMAKLPRYSNMLEDYIPLLKELNEGKDIPILYENYFLVCFKKAEEGNVVFQYNVADMYSKGVGVEQNWTKAKEYYKLSSKEKLLISEIFDPFSTFLSPPSVRLIIENSDKKKAALLEKYLFFTEKFVEIAKNPVHSPGKRLQIGRLLPDNKKKECYLSMIEDEGVSGYYRIKATLGLSKKEQPKHLIAIAKTNGVSIFCCLKAASCRRVQF